MSKPQRHLSSSMRTSWASVAFMVESVLLLVFLVASLAILTQVFSSSLNQSVESRTADAATIAASSIAEHFAADPTDFAEEVVLGDLRITTTVTDEPRAGGVMHRAHISVYDISATGKVDPVYEIDTSNYESEAS